MRLDRIFRPQRPEGGREYTIPRAAATATYMNTPDIRAFSAAHVPVHDRPAIFRR